jgi:transposase
MKRFIEGADRTQTVLFPAALDDYVAEDNAVCVIDAFVDTLILEKLGFGGALPADTGRPSYHPSILLKIYIYGYLNRIQSSQRLERETQRNVELMWLTGRLAPDFKTIADFRKDNGVAIRGVCIPSYHFRRLPPAHFLQVIQGRTVLHQPKLVQVCLRSCQRKFSMPARFNSPRQALVLTWRTGLPA